MPSRPAPDDLRQRLYVSLLLNAFIIGGEFIGGAFIQSVGLMSDAMHNLVDQGSLFLTLYAYLLAARPATARSTFGFHRAGILTALVNAVLLIMTAIGLVIMAVWRLLHPVAIPGGWVVTIAIVSFAANMSIALLLKNAAKKDLNIRSAFWHMFGDAWICFGVAVSGAVMMVTHWTFVDPLISLVVVVAILKGAAPVLKECLEVLMESAPRDIKTSEVLETIQSVPGVREVHDLHIWTLKPGITVLTCHVVSVDNRLSQSLMTAIREKVSQNYKIHHITVQLETSASHPQRASCDLGHV